MTRLLLVAHAPLASALLRVAEHVFPDCSSGVEAIDVEAGADSVEIDSALQRHLARFADEPTLVLVDVFGATPCNAATRAADGRRVRVVAGVNVPMLWRTLCYQGEDLDALVERAVAGGGLGVMHVAVPLRQNQSANAFDTGHDQVKHSDQQ